MSETTEIIDVEHFPLSETTVIGVPHSPSQSIEPFTTIETIRIRPYSPPSTWLITKILKIILRELCIYSPFVICDLYFATTHGHCQTLYLNMDIWLYGDSLLLMVGFLISVYSQCIIEKALRDPSTYTLYTYSFILAAHVAIGCLILCWTIFGGVNLFSHHAYKTCSNSSYVQYTWIKIVLNLLSLLTFRIEHFSRT